MACTFCRDPLFHDWLQSLSQRARDDSDAFMPNEAGAKAFITTACGIESRNELDTDPQATERFHRLVRAPFVAWREARHADE